MADEYLRLGDLPKEFQEGLMREFVPYSVGIGRVSSRNKHLLKTAGSGTLVSKGGRFGILTARHCARELRRGSTEQDLIAVVLHNRAVYLPPDSVFEHKLTTPSSEEYGPDLDFLEIAPCEQRRTLLAIASAWSLDRDVSPLLREFTAEGTLLASLGFPEERCKTMPISEGFRRVSYHLICNHVIQKDDIIERDGWDYIQSKCFYCDENDLPRSFGGTSGGGIWAMQVGKDKSTGKLSIGRSALVGVSFDQTKIENNERYVRGHFIKSIYNVAWGNSQS